MTVLADGRQDAQLVNATEPLALESMVKLLDGAVQSALTGALLQQRPKPHRSAFRITCTEPQVTERRASVDLGGV